MRILTSASRSRLRTAPIIGRRPMNSGIMPNFTRSSGSTWANSSPASRSMLRAHGAVEPDALVPDALLDDLLEAGERSTEDEQHVGRVDLDELLVRMLAATLRRHRRLRALEDLQQRLLDAFTRHVAGDRRVLALAGDLVDLVDVDDAGLGLLDVEVGGLDQLEEDVLDVLADVAGLGERRGVGDGERHVEQPGERLREVGLAAPGGAEQQDVGLRPARRRRAGRPWSPVWYWIRR